MSLLPFGSRNGNTAGSCIPSWNFGSRLSSGRVAPCAKPSTRRWRAPRAARRREGGLEPQPGLRRGGYLQRDARGPRGSRRSRGVAPRGHFAGQVVPEAGGSLPLPRPFPGGGSSSPSGLTAGGSCARPPCSCVGSPALRWTRFSSNRGQVGGGNAASVRRGSTGSRWRMCVMVRRSSNYPRGGWG